MKKRLLILAVVASAGLIGTTAIASADDGGSKQSISFCTTVNNSFVSTQASALFGTPVAVPFTECYIPAGGTATIGNVTFNACDGLTYGYQLNLVANQDVASFPEFVCGPTSARGATIGPVAAPTLIRIYLRDNTCNGYTYYSDGPHAAVTGTGPWDVAISDAGGPPGCAFPPAIPRSPFPQPNLQLTLTISGPASAPED